MLKFTRSCGLPIWLSSLKECLIVAKNIYKQSIKNKVLKNLIN